MKIFPFTLIIAGFGQNTGKTTVAKAIIKKFSKNYAITAIKISPHKHDHKIPVKPLIQEKGFVIFQELDTDAPKDSSVMLKNGAKRVFYIEADDRRVAEAWEYFIKNLYDDELLVIESPALAHLIKPGVLLIMRSNQVKQIKKSIYTLIKSADAILDLSEISSDEISQRISISDSIWKWTF